MKEILVVCETLKRADILFDKFITALKEDERTDWTCVKSRREVRLKRVQIIRFTSERRFRQCYQYGFNGKVVDEYKFEKSLDNDIKLTELWKKARDEFLEFQRNQSNKKMLMRMSNEQAIKILEKIRIITTKYCLSLTRGNGKSSMELTNYLEHMQAIDMAIEALKSQIKEPDLEYTRKFVMGLKEQYPDAYDSVDNYIKSLEVNE